MNIQDVRSYLGVKSVTFRRGCWRRGERRGRRYQLRRDRASAGRVGRGAERKRVRGGGCEIL